MFSIRGDSVAAFLNPVFPLSVSPLDFYACRGLRVLYVVSYLISRITELVKITLEHVTARQSHAQKQQLASKQQRRTHTHSHTSRAAAQK